MAPKPVVGEFGTAPPATDRIVAAEIFLVCNNIHAEFGERQPASQVDLVTTSVVLVIERAQLFTEASDGRLWAEGKPFQQRT